jgi:filamentous hemagglutinin
VNGQHVLAPVVYLSKATATRLQNDGALIAADVVDIQSQGAVRNDGSLSGTRGTAINADTLINTGALQGGQQLAIATRHDAINRGTLSADTVRVQAGGDLLSTGAISSTGNMALQAGHDLTVGAAPVQSGGALAMLAGHDLTANAGAITAAGDARLVAGHDVDLKATAHTRRSGNAADGQESSTHTLTGLSTGGDLAIVAGHDVRSEAAQLSAGGQVGLAAGHDVTLAAVADSQVHDSRRSVGHTDTTTRTDDESLRGTQIDGKLGVRVTAKHDLAITSGQLTSSDGNLVLSAGHDLALNAAQEHHSTYRQTDREQGGFFASTQTRTRDATQDSLAIGTQISAHRVTAAAGHDLDTHGAQIAGTGDVSLAAGHDLTIGTATSTHSESTSKPARPRACSATGRA